MIKLNYQLEGEGEIPLIFLHGLGGTFQDYDVLTSIFRKNFKILRFDLRGFGKSEKPLLPRYDTELWANDLDDLMTFLKIKKAILVGHSLGGRVACHFASLFSHKTLGLIPLNMTMWGSNPGFKSNLLKIASQVSEQGMELALPWIQSFSDPQIASFVKKEILANDSKAFALAMESVAEDCAQEKPAEFFAKIKCPTLILLGDRDIAPLEGAMTLKSYLVEARLEVIPDCGHYSLLEKPYLVKKFILDTFRNLI